MHIHELNPKKTIIALTLFVIVIIVGLLTITNPRLNYKLSPEETVECVASDDGYVLPYELEDVLVGSVDTVILIDIRNTFDFSRGHIPGAENISAVELLNEDNIERLEKLKSAGYCVLIYGDSQLQANGPCMVYRQLGFDNVKALMGGYQYYNLWKDSLPDSYADDGYLLGAPKYDYADLAAKSNIDETDDNSNKSSIKIQRRKKSTVAEGGC
jgi:rhodanese-related sulfurtransferase